MNKINPETLRVADIKHDYRKLQQASKALVQHHGLQHLNTASNLATEAVIDDLSNAFNLVIRVPNATWADVHTLLANEGLLIKPAGRGLLITDKAGKVAIKPSQLGREFSRPNLEKRLGDYQPTSTGQELSEKAEKIERSAKIESCQRWAKETLTNKFQATIADNNSSWHDIHTLLANEGLLIKPAGRGLLITDKAGKVAIKPSQLGREFSRANLEKRLGDYQPASADIDVATCQYRQAPKQGGSQRLWDDYTHLSETRKAKRKEDYVSYTKERDAHAENIKTEFAAARSAIWKDKLLSSIAKRRLAKELSLKRKTASARLKAHNATLRDQINSRTSIPSWRDYLLDKAQSGDTDAIKSLRNSTPKTEPIQNKQSQQFDDKMVASKTPREALIDEYNALRESVWQDKLLNGKQKYRLNKYINKRQKDALTVVNGAGWKSYVAKQAEQGDEVAKAVLAQKNHLADRVTATDIATIAEKDNNAQIKPNGDVALGEYIIIRNNRIHILASTGTGCRKALDFAVDILRRITHKPAETEHEQSN